MKKSTLVLAFTLAFAGMAHANENLPLSSESPLSETAASEETNRCWTGNQITGPIWNNDHAPQVCPAVCSNIGGQWTGNWNTVIWGERSVCECTIC
jgi:hypothetical protein